ncbi:UvrD-helicase domain-containing protein [Ancylomarina longa]|uniref:DNA 3'-5' helicase n=1 Tax=Ancylomarina longa TaxID=2487017 RepID=A0A434AWM7_9BACT|nr:UvrD-helicase domain-containing protein [Ancylomarina longa]RUT78902.1 hypothetical protein DLK05_05300 [Ancylomarina longa]
MSRLTIYRASAGSGKTFTLTNEYLNLVFDDPLNYKTILAVTFTNKATDEMKSRIVKEIYILSEGTDSAYAADLCAKHQWSPLQLKVRAKEILTRLLHDYSRFSVTTIDSFFQKVVRSFTREIGLQMGYNIELDQGRVLNEVVDLLLLEVDHDSQLRAWLSAFAESKIRDGKTWNFKQDIMVLGREVFKEDFQNFSDQLILKLSDKNFLSSYRKSLAEIKTDFENYFAQIGEKARNLIQQQGLDVANFSYGKSGVAGYLTSLGLGGKMEPGIRARNAMDTVQKWMTGKASSDEKQAIESVFYGGLNELLKDAIVYYDEQGMLYRSIDKTLGYIYTLGILTDLSKQIQKYTEGENIFLLSDASRLLRNIIGDNDSPFIYEKIGNAYQHFMIDEFQDTSAMQWDNFRPLVANSLSEDHHSLVVGDVKQSIYRWRNGDWKLLSEQLDKDFKSFGVDGLSLNYNWRSSRNIIDFNNAVFALASQILQNDYNASIPSEISESLNEEQQKILNAYQDVYQHLPDKKEKVQGYVNIQFIDKETEQDWTDKVLEDLPYKIELLQENGYQARDIAILVRNGREGGIVADTLMSYAASENAIENVNYEVISNDSLYLKNASVVNFLIHLLHFFVYPEDKINLGFLKQEFQVYIQDNEPGESDDMFAVIELETFLESCFPSEFLESIPELKRQPLYDLVEKLIAIFHLNNNPKDYPYLEAFQDFVLGFTKNDAPELNAFLQYWQERKEKEVISVSDQQDAIRIMTIHKSKGLEFKAVILPFCNWDIDNTRHTNILWCQPKVEGFNTLDVLPVRYSSTLRDTIYFEAYFTEKLQAYIDNLNLLYVAQTRAEEVFIAYAPNNENKEIKTIADLLKFLLENATNYTSDFFGNKIVSLSNNWNAETGVFELGTLSGKSLSKALIEKKNLESYPASLLDDRLKLRSHSADYFDFSEADSVENFSPVSRGNILHQLFQLIHYSDDLEKAVKQLQFEGKIDEKQAHEISDFASGILADPSVSGFFTREWTVINERDILLGKGDIQRPDRVIYKDKQAVVIDYKFGMKKLKSHINQISTYKRLIQQLGFEEVKAYILYGKLSEMVEV